MTYAKRATFGAFGESPKIQPNSVGFSVINYTLIHLSSSDTSDSEGSSFGAKAVAEIPKDGVAPALRNAIADATGVRINAIPFTPERVWRALQGA